MVPTRPLAQLRPTSQVSVSNPSAPLGEIFGELALRAVAAAAILIDDGIAVADEMARHLGPGHRLAMPTSISDRERALLP